MVLKKTLDALKELGCLNPEEYVDVRTHNLIWKCVDCGKEYQRSCMHQKKGTKCCAVCAKKRNVTSQKISKEVLSTMGCVNTNDYINVSTKNLRWSCSSCGGIFITSYASQRLGRHLCPSCVITETVRPHKNSESTLLSFGVLNPEEYLDTHTNNLRCLCVTCGQEYITTLSTLKKSTKQCKKCTYELIASKTKLPLSVVSTFNVLNPEEYINIKEKNMKTYCDKCESVYTTSIDVIGNKYNSKHFCPSCSISISSQELEVVEFLQSFYKGTIETNTRNVIPPLELDIYLPDLKLAIELNGVYWHSSKHKERNYHKSKFLACKEKGIKLLQFWDITWNKKKDIIKSMLRTQMNSNTLRVPARTCNIKEVDLSTARDFLDSNHLQGFGTGSTKYLGLFKDDTMVSLMTFKDIGDNVWDLTRFCSLKDTTVIGGASKLLKYFIKTQEPSEVISFSDNMYSNGGLYGTLGFTEVAQIRPDYKYLDKDELYHKFGYRHDKLKAKLEKYDKNLTEKENCENHNIQQVFDAGKIKWSLKIL